MSRVLNFLKKSFEEGTSIGKENVMFVCYIGAPAHIIFYFVYKYYFGLYENIYLRITASLLCASVIFYDKLPPKFQRKIFPFYWHIAITFATSFIFSVYLFKTNFHEVWLYWELFMIFALSIHVPNWVMFVVDALIGTVGGFLFYLFTTPNFDLNPQFNVTTFLIAFIFSGFAGQCFVYGNRRLWLRRERESIELWSRALSGSIAHEMRNPLNAINLSLNEIAELIPHNQDQRFLSKEEIEKINEYKAIGLSSIKRANQVINMILAEIKNQKAEEENLVNIYVKKIIEKAISEYGYNSKDEKLRLVLDLKQDFIIKADETLLIYVLFNLMKNALYYPNSKVTISTLVKENFNCIRIHDTGPGIASEKLKNLFCNFYSIDKKGGTGLGLSFCKRTIESFNAKIFCESEEGKFTQFTLQFPMLSQPITDIKTQILDKALEEFNLSNKNILVVDDQDTNRMLTSRFLKKYNAKIYEAKDGLEAIAKSKEIKLDLILMDIEMPGISGIEAIIEIRKLSNVLPIIAVTGDDNPDRLFQIINSGFDDCFVKGGNYEILLSMVRGILGD